MRSHYDVVNNTSPSTPGVDPLKLDGQQPNSYFLDESDPSATQVLGRFGDTPIRNVEYETSFGIDHWADQSQAPSMNDNTDPSWPRDKGWRIVPNNLIPGSDGDPKKYSLVHKDSPTFVENDPRMGREEKRTRIDYISRSGYGTAYNIETGRSEREDIKPIDDPQMLYEHFIYDQQMDPEDITPEMLYPLVTGGKEVVDNWQATSDVKKDHFTRQSMLVPQGEGTPQEDWNFETNSSQEDADFESEYSDEYLGENASMDDFFADLTEYLNNLDGGEGSKGANGGTPASNTGVLTAPSSTTITPTSQASYIAPGNPIIYNGGYAPSYVPEISRGSGQSYGVDRSPPDPLPEGTLTEDEIREQLGLPPIFVPEDPDPDNPDPDNPDPDNPDPDNPDPGDPDPGDPDPGDPDPDDPDPDDPVDEPTWAMAQYLFANDEQGDWLRQQGINSREGKSYKELSDELYNDQNFLEFLQEQGGDDWEEDYFGYENGGAEVTGYINLKRLFYMLGASTGSLGPGIHVPPGLRATLEEISEKYGGVPVDIFTTGHSMREEFFDLYRATHPNELRMQEGNTNRLTGFWNILEMGIANGSPYLDGSGDPVQGLPGINETLVTGQTSNESPIYQFGYGTDQDIGTMVYDPLTDRYTPWSQFGSLEEANRAAALSNNWNPPPWEPGHDPYKDIYGYSVTGNSASDGMTWHQFLLLNGIEYQESTGEYVMPGEDYDWEKPFTYDFLESGQDSGDDIALLGIPQTVEPQSENPDLSPAPDSGSEDPFASTQSNSSTENNFLRNLESIGDKYFGSVPGIKSGAIPAAEYESGKGAPAQSAGNAMSDPNYQEQGTALTPLSGGLSAPIQTPNGYGTRRRGLFVRNI